MGALDKYYYNGETDFEKWYEDVYKKSYDPTVGFQRAAGMDDGTWNTGSVLYKYYQLGRDDENNKQLETENINTAYDEQSSAVKANSEASRSALDVYKKAAQQNAAVSYHKMNKYIPQQMKAQGRSGLNLGATAGLKAYTAYSNNMGDIAKNYNDNMAAVNSEEISKLANIESSRDISLREVLDKYADRKESRISAAGSEAQSAWDKYLAVQKKNEDEVFDRISDSTSSTVEGVLAGIPSDSVTEEQRQVAEDIAAKNKSAQARSYAENMLVAGSDLESVKNYILQNKGIFTNDDYISLMQAFNAAEAQYEASKVQSGNIKSGLAKNAMNGNGNDFTATVNGKDYSGIETKGKITDAAILNAASKLSDGSVFKYKGKIYVYNGGKCCEVVRRRNGSEAEWTELVSSLRELAK